tara:strand:- start:6337 stop:7173 length:837 start_codon:yes stop_codon:yes gene_type:complete
MIEQWILTGVFAFILSIFPPPKGVGCPYYCDIDHEHYMRVYKVNSIDCKVYEPDDVLPENLIIQSDWRDGQVGDWVKTDDDCVIEVLRRGTMKKKMGKNKIVEYIGTCTGTFLVSSKTKMDASKRDNIYSFSGKKVDDIVYDRKELNNFETLFVTYVAKGMTPVEAYLKSFPTNSPGYAKIKSGQLLKMERIKTAMKEELKPVLEELGINENYVLETIKGVIDSTDKDETRLKALFKLADIMDMEDKNKTTVTQVSGALFKGFSDEMIEQAERPKEIE